MTSQNLFYITASGAIILISLLIVFLIILAIIFALRMVKFSRRLSAASLKLEEFIEKLKQKLKYSAVIALAGEGLKELIEIIKEKRGGKGKKKK